MVEAARGGRRSQKTRSYSYTVSLAIALCEGEIAGIGRIWADGLEYKRSRLNLRVYTGSEAQLPDAKIEAVEGAGNAPAYRGVAYVVIEDLPLGDFGNRVPQFSFEVIRHVANAPAEAQGLSDIVEAVALMPGTGEYALATTKVTMDGGFADERIVNVHARGGRTNLQTSLDQLETELPSCDAVSLIVSWFGDDLRAGLCQIKPKVEQKQADGKQMPWRVSGVTRNAAETLAQENGRAIYGGTPSDASVVEAIQDARARGKRVYVLSVHPDGAIGWQWAPGSVGSARAGGFALAWTDHHGPGPWRTRDVRRHRDGRCGSFSFFGCCRPN